MFFKNKNVISIAIIILCVCIFFYRLFFPRIQVFVTPDFQVSDLWDYTFAEKFYLGNALKQGVLPDYTNLLLNGTSLLSDGQIASFNLVNQFLYRIFPNPVAFNIGYVFSFLLSALGMYALCKHWKLSSLSSCFSAIVFTFSSLMIFKISHYTLMENIAYIPFIFLCVDKFLSAKIIKTKIVWMFSFVLLISQQFLNGQFQITFITVIGLCLYFIGIRIWKFRHFSFRDGLLLLLGICVCILLSSPVLISVYNLYIHSLRNSSVFSLNSLIPSFSLQNIATFLNPYIFGTPQNGTYMNNGLKGDIFWENVIYIGIIPFILCLYAVLSKKKNILLKIILFSACISFFLMLGQNSIFYPIFLFSPFNLFRAPSRFMVLFIFALAIVSGIGMNTIQKNKKVINISHFLPPLLLFITIIDLFVHFYSYHPIVSYEEWVKPPETVLFLQNKQDNRYFTYGGNYVWEKYFDKKGWADNIDVYKFLENSLQPKTNIIYGIPSTQTFSSSFFISKEEYLILSKINLGMGIREGLITITDESVGYLQLLGVRYLIVPYDILSPSQAIKKVFETNVNSRLNISFKIYEIAGSKPDYYFPSTVTYYKDINDFQNLVKGIVATNEAYIESNDPTILDKKNTFPDSASNTIILLEKNDTRVHLSVQSDNVRPLILSNSYSNYWTVEIDSQKATMQKANGKLQAITIPPGIHDVYLYYDSGAIRYLSYLSLIGSISILIIIVFYFLFSLVAGTL